MYRKVDVRNDLFNSTIGELLLNDIYLRHKLMKSLSTQYADSQNSSELRKNHKLVWIVFAHFRHQEKTPKDWLSMPSGLALGANLLSIEFAKNGAIQRLDQRFHFVDSRYT